jgi:putative hydrolase of the HAD superfamily
MRVKAIFFDIDDTLFPTTEFTAKARRDVISAMIEVGLDVDEREGYEKLLEVIGEYGSNYPAHFDRLLEKLRVPYDARYVAAGIVAYHDAKLSMHCYPDTKRTLAALRERGYALGVVSDGLAVKQWDKIIRLGLEHFFDAVVVSEAVGVEKPDARIFGLALKRFSLKPAQAAYVGDRLDKDVAGAKAAGMVAVHVRRDGKGFARGVKPDHAIKRISELLHIFK